MTADEITLLGSSATAIVLRWSWRDEERATDPSAVEFRVYAAPPMDAVHGTILSVAVTGTGRVTSYHVELQLEREVPADLLAGLRLDAGHPFLIRSHSSGSTIDMTVETRLRVGGAAPVPAPGPVRLAAPMTPDRNRPPAWGARVAVVPITGETRYEVVLRDRLEVSADRSRDAIWVGVSSADAEAYVADQLAPVETRPGNESAIVAAQAIARYAGRPVLEIPPPLEPVPVVRAPEPTAQPIHFPLDLTPFLPTLPTPRVRPERVAAGAVLAACALRPDGRVVGTPVDPVAAGDVEAEIAIPNPGDRDELVAAMRAGDVAAVDDRFCVFLAAHHPFRDRLFRPVTDGAVPLGPFPETLPPNPDRWVYRVRAVDAAGHVSAGSATARVVVRVPNLMPGAPPLTLPREPGDSADVIRVRIADDRAVTHLLMFSAPSIGPGTTDVDEVIRVPNRTDLLPARGLWVRAPDGTLVTPTAVAVMPGSDVTVTVPGAPGERTRVWFATLTVDGIPSTVAGPFSMSIPSPV